jgi:hypothetical protein
MEAEFRVHFFSDLRREGNHKAVTTPEVMARLSDHDGPMVLTKPNR